MWRYSQWFSQTPVKHRLSLGEGDTPLVRSRRIGPSLGLDHLYFKLESSNPTGSYKDRFASAAVSCMRAAGKNRIIATSSGNTGAALAAYAAAAGFECEIAIVETAPDGKLKQMAAYGAQIHKIKGFGLDADISRQVFEQLKAKGQRPGAELLISAFAHSPEGMQGVQTISYELADQAKADDAVRMWDHVLCPAGGGGLTLAVARGFAQMERLGRIMRTPQIHCVQPLGNDTIATPLAEGRSRAHAVNCTSAISGLQVPSVIDGDAVIAACRASGGSGQVVSDEEVWTIQSRLAREEGVFSEPAGAVALAGAIRAVASGRIAATDRVCCLVTGSGFKDPASLDRMLKGWECPMMD